MATISSGAGPSATVTLTITEWWEVDPTTPSSAVAAQPVSWNPVQYEQSASRQVMGQHIMNVVADAVQNPDFQGTFHIFTVDIEEAFQALLTSQKIIWVASPFGARDSGYFRIGPAPGGMSMGLGNAVKNSQLQASTAAAPYRIVQVTAIAAARPPV